ncbi:MAG: fatty-acyl-CoA synthase, partial [Candidatus Azotimanducaceae bacterium]
MSVLHYDWTQQQSNIRPNKIAIKDLDSGAELSYSQLDHRSESLGAWLQSNNVKKGDRVALLLPNMAEFFEIQFACSKVGAICLPLNWRLSEKELEYILKDSTPSVLIFDSTFQEVANSLVAECDIKQSLEINGNEDAVAYETALNEAHSFTPVESFHSDTSMIMYTSGTTGHPKGAMITHEMTFYNCVNLGIPSKISSDSIQLVVLPLFHTGGLNCYANPILHAGGTLLLMRDFDPGRALSILSDSELGVTHFFAVPAPYQFMMQHKEFEQSDLTGIKAAGVGGAPCAEAILKAWAGKGIPLLQGWGMTETSPGGTGLDAADALRKVGSAGKALHHTQIKIIDDKGDEIRDGGVGELLIKGPNITPGYWNNPEATAKTFADGWLLTGDAARMDDEGFVYIVDRWKDMYITGGENVYPAEIENIIYELPEIAEAAVIGVPSERWGETGKAVIVLKPGKTLEPDDIIAHCLANLAKFKVPQSVSFIDALPRNATGKILKREI